MNKAEVESIVNKKIALDEQIGEASGGSGHLSNTSYLLHNLQISESETGLFVVIYNYSIFIETEFTYYPDNPPYEYKFQKTLHIDKQGEISFEGEKIPLSKDPSNDWLEIQEEINSYLSYILTRIEWHYGDNRAPFKFPPIYEFNVLPFAEEYRCILKGDEGFNNTEFVFTSCKAVQLFEKVKEELPNYINLDFIKEIE